MKPVFWKLSMGPGGKNREFSKRSVVDKWLARGLVLVHEETGIVPGSAGPQGETFLEADRVGEYFYLCHGNKSGTGIILVGRFTTGNNQRVSLEMPNGGMREGFRARPFLKIKELVASNPYYDGEMRPWTPNFRSTFIRVPDTEMDDFERLILEPYFDLRLSDSALG